MKKLLLCICVFGMLSGLCLAADSSMGASTISAGLWEGQASLKALAGKDAGSSLPAGTPSSLSLTLSMQLFGQGKGALLDIAEQSMYGYPLSNVRWTEKRLHFELDAMGPGQEMTFEGLMTPAGGPQKQAAIIGTVNSKSWKGSFMLSLHVIPESPNEFSFPIKLEDGSLPGTLALPENALSAPANALSAGDAGFMQVPLVILLSGGGPTDRDGNNFNVPGRTNALKQLAQGLAVKGVACFRFDKRGSGEAYWLENPEQVTSLKIHARDAAQVIRQFRSDKRFSRILLAGMNEGAWVGALALNALAEENVFVDGLVVIDASGEEPEDQLAASLSGLGPEVQAEAGRIRQAI
ncbi:MAG: hypothetical protein LLF89_10650, partial [Spirochaetaceae bacterium]|nr:hypothetical protein [Spirochaetaceae bacterium]